MRPRFVPAGVCLRRLSSRRCIKTTSSAIQGPIICMPVIHHISDTCPVNEKWFQGGGAASRSLSLLSFHASYQGETSPRITLRRCWFTEEECGQTGVTERKMYDRFLPLVHKNELLSDLLSCPE